MVICLERGADLHTAQLMPLPLTVSCFRKIQIGFTFLVPAHLGSPGKGPLNGCVCIGYRCRIQCRVQRESPGYSSALRQHSHGHVERRRNNRRNCLPDRHRNADQTQGQLLLSSYLPFLATLPARSAGCGLLLQTL